LRYRLCFGVCPQKQKKKKKKKKKEAGSGEDLVEHATAN
jgi:hypothetical protein